MNDKPNKVTIQDSTGRSISIRKLTALDRMRLFEVIGGDLANNQQWFGFAFLAASVTEINGQPEPWPTSKKTLESRVGVLQEEGLDAIGEAYVANFSKGESGNLDDIRPLSQTQP